MIVFTPTLRAATLALGAFALSALSWLPAAPAAPQDAELPVVREADGERISMEPRIADLSWLEGNWAGSDGSSDWESVYTGGRGNVIVGASKELKGERCIMMDFEHFYERAGELRMRPFPFGKPSVEFTLNSDRGEARRAVFENPEHDFPNTFVYHRVADDRLKITLVGDMGDGEVEFTLDLKRVDVQ